MSNHFSADNLKFPGDDRRLDLHGFAWTGHGQQFLIWADQVRLVIGPEPGAAPLHGGGGGQPGTRQGLRGPRAVGDMRHPPADEGPRQPRVRVIVDDHRRDPGQAQLLGNAQADPAQTADDDMPAPVRVRSRHLVYRPTLVLRPG